MGELFTDKRYVGLQHELINMLKYLAQFKTSCNEISESNLGLGEALSDCKDMSNKALNEVQSFYETVQQAEEENEETKEQTIQNQTSTKSQSFKLMKQMSLPSSFRFEKSSHYFEK